MVSITTALGKADLVEFDVRESADGVLMVMHDATVDRTTDGTGAVASLTQAQLQALDAGSWFSTGFTGTQIPTLTQALQAIVPAATPLIHQYSGSPAQYVAVLSQLGLTTNVVVQSFDWSFLSSLHALEPAIRLAVLGTGGLGPAELAEIINTGASVVAWDRSAITSNEVALVHGAGLSLYVWTVNGPLIKTFIDLGVDGIISNDPGMVKALQQPAANRPEALANQLVAYWSMDDGLSNNFTTTVADSKGANSATLVRSDGASHWLDGSAAKFDGCLALDGTNAFVTIPQTESLDLNTNAITFSAWAWLPSLPSQMASSYGSIYDSTTDCYVLYLDKANQELRFKLTDVNGKAARPGIPEALLQTNRWLHLAATFSGSVGPVSGQTMIYLNGQAVDVHTGADDTSPVGLTGNIKTGQFAAMGREGPNGGNFFTGLLDDVAIWKRALAPAEISQVYRSGLAGLALDDLLRQPTTLIQLLSVAKAPGTNQLQITFQNRGPWQSFRLLRSDFQAGPFRVVPGLWPVALRNGTYRFDYGLTNKMGEFFEVEAE